MNYSDDDKALIMLSYESSYPKKRDALDSADSPKELYRDYSHADVTIEEMNRKGIVAITLNSKYYPSCLKNIYDPPQVLYCKGDVSLLSDTVKRLAIVGTRRITRYGKDVTREFARAFSEAGCCVVSGMARGVDSEAHKTVLAENGKTIAVLGCGADVIYPSENAGLYDEIANKGLIVSEYPLGTPPHAFRFPERNRIISGLSEGVLVTEAGAGSGSMITADLAIEQGKDLYVVPGNIFSQASKGCNDKIKELQAAAVTCPEDIIKVGKTHGDRENLAVQLTLEQARIISFLEDCESAHFSELLAKSGLSVNELTALLSEMEIYGFINKLSGNYYAIAQKL